MKLLFKTTNLYGVFFMKTILPILLFVFFSTQIAHSKIIIMSHKSSEKETLPSRPQSALPILADGFVICGNGSHERAEGDGCVVYERIKKEDSCFFCNETTTRLMNFKEYLKFRKGNVEFLGISPYTNSNDSLRVIIYYRNVPAQ